MKRILSLMLVMLSFCGAVQAQEESCGPTNLCWPVVKRDARGPRVTALQYLLRAKGFKLAPDGRFGFSTESALRKFQAKNKLKVDGKVGWQSWEALTPKLQRGARGDAVRALQTLLNTYVYGPEVTRDGVFGAATQKPISLIRKDLEGVALLAPKGQVGKTEWCYASGGHLEGE